MCLQFWHGGRDADLSKSTEAEDDELHINHHYVFGFGSISSTTRPLAPNKPMNQLTVPKQ
jgi:hypothetical protein